MKSVPKRIRRPFLSVRDYRDRSNGRMTIDFVQRPSTASDHHQSDFELCAPLFPPPLFIHTPTITEISHATFTETR